MAVVLLVAWRGKRFETLVYKVTVDHGKGHSSVVATETDKLIKRFLLGQLSDEQRVAVEERLFKEDAFYGEVLAVQEELADDYVSGDLSPSERAQVNNFFLKSPRRQKRLEFATTLSQALVQPAPRVVIPVRTAWHERPLSFFRGGFAFATAAAAVLLMILTGWLWMQNRRLTTTVEQARAENDALQQSSTDTQESAARKAKDLEDQLAALKQEGGALKTTIDQKEKELENLRRIAATPSSRTNTSLSAFILSPGLTRGNDEPEKLIVPPGTSTLRLQLDLEREENFKGYVAEIRTARGNLVWSKSGIPMHRTNYGQAVSIVVPSSLLPNGEYEVTLKGVAGRNVQTVGYYYFITLPRPR